MCPSPRWRNFPLMGTLRFAHPTTLSNIQPLRDLCDLCASAVNYLALFAPLRLAIPSGHNPDTTFARKPV